MSYNFHLLCLGLTLYATTALAGETITIAPGDSIAAAVQSARDRGIHRILLHGGQYPVSETVELDQRDNGLAIAAVEGEAPILDGGIRLRDGQIAADGRIEYDLAAAGYDNARMKFEPFGCGIKLTKLPPSLYCNGKPLEEAREPDCGFLGITEVLNATNCTFKTDAYDLKPLRGATGLRAHGYWWYGWADSEILAAVIDGEYGPAVKIDPPGGWSHGRIREQRGFYFLGLRSFLNRDSEWFFDRQRGRAVVSRNLKNGEITLANYPRPFFNIVGAREIAIRGLHFRYGQDLAVAARRVTGLVFTDNLVENFSRAGMEVLEASHSRIKRNRFHTFGTFGLKLVGGDRKSLIGGDNLVENNEFYDASRFVRSGMHALVLNGMGTTVVHNHFHDMPGAAVRFDGNDHLFTSNVCERCVLEADDWGSVECCGTPFFRGSKIVHNLFKDIGAVNNPYNYAGQCGVRLDDTISGMYIYGNRFINSSTLGFGGVQINGGKDNVVANNLFVGGRSMLSVLTWDPNLWRNFPSLKNDEKLVEPYSERWQRKYGDLSDCFDRPTRNYLRNNIAIDVQLPVYIKEHFACEVVFDNNAFNSPDLKIEEWPGFDPLPPLECLGIQKTQERGMKPLGIRDGIGHVMEKIRAGKEIGVAYFGGSITQMDGWRRLSQVWLKQHYPKAKFREIFAAIGGTGSDLGVFRVGKDVISQHPDLVFVEFATNDSPKNPNGILSNFDGIVRQIWANDPETDIVFVYTVTASTVKDYLAGRAQGTVRLMETVANHYGIPSVDWGAEVARQYRSGKLVMSMGEAYTALAPDVKNKDTAAIEMLKREGKVLFSKDGVHPALPGHEIYVSELQALWKAMEQLPPVDHRIKSATACFTPRMERAKMIQIEPSMLDDGWEPLKELKEGNFNESTDGKNDQVPYFSSRAGKLWKATRAGATLTFRFQGNYCAIYDLLGPGCGVAEIWVDGKRMNDMRRYDGYCSYYRLGSFKVFDGAEGRHEVKIVRSAKHDSKNWIRNRSPKTPRDKYNHDYLLFGSIMVVGEILP